MMVITTKTLILRIDKQNISILREKNRMVPFEPGVTPALNIASI